MTYASAPRRPNPAALAGALGVPSGFAALLVVGLAVSVATVPPASRLTGETVTETRLPPPPPPPEPEPQPTDSAAPKSVVPVAPIRPILPPVTFPIGEPIALPSGLGDSTATGIGTGPVEVIVPDPAPSVSLFDPVGARPKSNPARWVTNEDYRPRWILEEMAGTARFTLQIDASGKVTGCTVTRSTGHAPLDAATCQLVSQRARFDAARDSTGRPVPGSYSGMITWKIPR